MRVGIALAVALAMLASSGCSWARRAKHRHHPRHATAAEAPDLGVPQVPPHAAPPAHSAQVVEAQGATLASGRALAAGGRLNAGQWVDVAPDGKLVLDFTIDTRVEVDGGSRVRIGHARPAELWIAHGAARGLLSPGPTGARAPLHLGTPEMAVEIPGNGDAYVAVLPGAPTTMVFVLSGAAELRPGTLGDDGRPTTRELHPAQQATNDDEPVPGPDDIAAARARFAAVRVGDAHPRATTLDDVLPQLDAALDDMEAEDAARHALLAAPPAPQGSPEAAARLQQMIGAGQRQLWKRTVLLAAWERAQATAGTLTLDAAQPLIERDARVRTALGTDD